LKTGTQQRKIQLSGSGGSPLGDIGNAFAGRFFESQTDLGINYSDDLLYFGYNYEGSSWDGGVLRLVTHDSDTVSDWEVTKLIGGGDIGPVTSGVSRLEDTGNHKLWVYFGEGRYFTADDDPSDIRTIYGVKDPCYSGAGSMNTSCTTSVPSPPVSGDDVHWEDATTNVSCDCSSKDGWYINLDPSGGGYGAERVITDPVATTNGWVFYTTFMPTSDVCGFGGNTYIWMVDYETGGVPKNVGGVIFIQTSTGVIKKIELSKEFGTDKGTHGGRRLATPIAGAPSPSSGITVIVPPKPIKSLIQWRETPIRKGK
jgi:type IV pilus assembly protein PilY1